jgi:alpha-beta hydrolase superfamily lysophospholipase
LWTYREGVAHALTPRDLPLSSSLYGYGSTTWCVIDDEQVATIHERAGILGIWNREGVSVAQLSVPEGSLGAPVAWRNGLLLVSDGPEVRQRRFWFVDLESESWDEVYRTENFVSRVATNGSRAAWCEWSPWTVPWECAELVTAKYYDNFTVVSRRGGEDVSWGPPVAVGESFAATRESGEWPVIVTNIDVPDHIVEAPQGGPALSLVSWFGTSRLLASDGARLAVVVANRSARRVAEVVDGGLIFLDGALSSIEDVAWVDEAVAVAGRREWHSDRIECWADGWHPVVTRGEVDAATLRATWQQSESGVPYLWWGDESPASIIVDIHGGPTGEAGLRWSPAIARWRSRGWSVASVDYRGSTSYGRRYRRALYGQWGRHDVHDVRTVIDDLADRFPEAVIVVAGNSAGGFTALKVAESGVVKAVIAHYPVTDIATLMESAHEFEAGYNRLLFGSANIVELADRAIVASALPSVLLTHGTADAVVPIAGTRRFVDDARRLGATIEFVEIPDEGHGYRRSDSLETVSHCEAHFLNQ